ncbi:Piso0_000926 [Millerozyma farinosa CBS 7064]|uniref:Piso0_000926 protein n=1 Tax=Pichia sorbitophila (strain ATCC MYA-4447 / BCRC 22081 / CBS 7064 / NBRC 10061 / NRRL Y-12695) TaxID=559304 RepID=G8YRW9_PICSO|nr:Piso0_000926 [Millerozyma farinosa CBS 7064]
MSSNDNITKLVEMGFSRPQAEKALQITNNDVEEAIAYLFEEPIEVSGPDSNEKQQDTVTISNPQDIPRFDVSGGNLDGNKKEGESATSSGSSSSSNEYEMWYENNNTSEPHVNNFAGILNEKRSGNYPAIIPQKSCYLENYYIPILTALSCIEKFQETCLKPLKHDAQIEWNNEDNTYQIVFKEAEQIPDVSDYTFCAYLQIYLGFLNGLSERAYISADGLIKNVPSNVREVLQDGIERVDEFVPKLYECFCSTISNVHGESANVNDLFKSSVESANDEVINNIFTIDVDSEYYASTIYESFNELFWGADLEMLGNVRLIKGAEILTVLFVSEEETYNSTSFALDEVFHPEIYSSKYADLLIEMNRAKEGLHLERGEITKEIMRMNSFDGKRIKGLLDSTISYLGGQGRDTKDLEGISDTIAETKERLTEKLTAVNEQYASLDVRSVDNVLQFIKRSGMDPPSAYLLIGVVISDTDFYYRSGSGSWVHQKGTYSAKNDLVSMCVDEIDFTSVHQHLSSYTQSLLRPFSLIYARETLLGKSDTSSNEFIKAFFEHDNNLVGHESTISVHEQSDEVTADSTVSDLNHRST